MGNIRLHVLFEQFVASVMFVDKSVIRDEYVMF